MSFYCIKVKAFTLLAYIKQSLCIIISIKKQTVKSSETCMHATQHFIIPLGPWDVLCLMFSSFCPNISRERTSYVHTPKLKKSYYAGD